MLKKIIIVRIMSNIILVFFIAYFNCFIETGFD